MLDRRGPVRVRERPALIVRNRDEAGSRKFSNDVAQPRQVEPSVHGREKRHAQAAEQRKGQPIDVCVDHVEILRSLRDRFQQQSAGGVRVRPLSAQTERAGPHRVKLSVRPGIAAREERDVVAELDQLVDQPGDHPLGAAVELRGDAFGQGSKLGDTHRMLPAKLEGRAQGHHDGWRKRGTKSPTASNPAWHSRQPPAK